MFITPLENTTMYNKNLIQACDVLIHASVVFFLQLYLHIKCIHTKLRWSIKTYTYTRHLPLIGCITNYWLWADLTSLNMRKRDQWPIYGDFLCKQNKSGKMSFFVSIVFLQPGSRLHTRSNMVMVYMKHYALTHCNVFWRA